MKLINLILIVLLIVLATGCDKAQDNTEEMTDLVDEEELKVLESKYSSEELEDKYRELAIKLSEGDLEGAVGSNAYNTFTDEQKTEFPVTWNEEITLVHPEYAQSKKKKDIQIADIEVNIFECTVTDCEMVHTIVLDENYSLDLIEVNGEIYFKTD